jgi:AcrR family transcriptional regulator
VLKEAGVGKALLYRYFGDFVGLARAWAQGETFLPRPAAAAGGSPGEPAPALAAAAAERDAVVRHVASAMAYARALRQRPKTRELLALELLGSSPLTQALDGMRAQFGREMRQYVMASGAGEGEDAFALSFFVTAAMTYLAMRADHVPHYYGLRLDRDEDWQKVERMLQLVATRVLQPEGAVSASRSADAPPLPRP